MAIELITSDLEEEILSWVPARSLVRLKYTCKQWKTLIANPRFVNKQSSHMRCREKQFTVFNNVPDSKSPYLSGSIVSCVGDELNVHAGLNMHVFEPISFPNSSVIDMFHCDGLFLFVTRSVLLVLNPLLKQARWIVGGYEFDHQMYAYGLGYISNQSSSSCNDYKVVMFRSCGGNYRFQVDVYEFSSDRWRQDVDIDKTFDGFLGVPLSSVCLKGTPYWLGYDSFVTTSIRSFDFSKERFEHLFLPLTFIDSPNYISLGIFRGDHLSLSHYSLLTSKIHIWVMKSQWTRLMTVDMPRFSRLYSSYFIEKNSKLVLSGSNLETKFVGIYIVGESEECQKVEYFPVVDHHIIGGCYYVPSLLQIPGFSTCEEKE